MLDRRLPGIFVLIRGLLIGVVVFGSGVSAFGQGASSFGIQVVDETTGRGVPLVELTTTGGLRYVTDSGGWVAFDEPGLLGERVFFSVSSHGYEFAADGFGMRGRALQTGAGETAVLKIRRRYAAQRIYRVTGAGIYSDSVRLGQEVPIENGLLNGRVVGQDSVQNARIGDELFWFWGDTNRVRYPLGHFGTSAARSRLPSGGGLDPSRGVDLEYWVDDEGFSRPAFARQGRGLIWLDATMVVRDEAGESRVIGHYSVMQSLAKRLEHGLAEFDPETGMFTKRLVWPDDATLHPQGHVLEAGEGDERYLYFCHPFPLVRVPAKWDAVFDPNAYEAFTPVTGTDSEPTFHRTADGELEYRWRAAGVGMTARLEAEWIQRGRLAESDRRWVLKARDADRKVVLHAGTVAWNAYRGKYVMIATEVGGATSMLGDVWYVESDQVEGPWSQPVQVVEHDGYSFYNPRHHPYFDQEGGRVIYFEGTYTHTFSRTQTRTPRYDYNQVMYRLELDDPLLGLVVGEGSED